MSFAATSLLICLVLILYPFVNLFSPINNILCSSPSAKDTENREIMSDRFMMRDERDENSWYDLEGSNSKPPCHKNVGQI